MSFFEELKRRNVIRVAIAYLVGAWLLAQISELLLDTFNAPDWTMQFIVIVLGIGFFIALFFAWAFELTPEGIKREKDVDRGESITSQTGKKLDRTIMAIMAVVIVFLLADRFLLQEQPASNEQAVVDTTEQISDTQPDVPSVAVLPFVNMSGNRDNEYFSDGLTETLLHMLAQLPDLRVAARTSSFAFKGQNVSVIEIAESLGVAHVLEGSVQRAGERVRVTAQLIRAEDGFHVWSQNYDRTLEDIFAIQDEIATDVVTALDASLLGAEGIVSLATHDVDAYDLYLKALEQQAIFTYASLAETESLLKQSLAQDPGFIDAKLSLARNHSMMFGTGLIDEEEYGNRSLPLLDQVDAEQPGNPVARALRLLVSLFDEEARETRQQTIDELSMLLTAIPTETFIRSTVAAWLAGFYKQEERALQMVNAGLLVDPLDAFLHSRRGEVLSELGRFDEARESMSRAIELQPGYASAYSKMAEIVAAMGNMTAKLDWMRKAVEVDPEDHELASWLAIDFYQLDMPEEGDRWASRVMALAPESDVGRVTALHGLMAHGRIEEAESAAKAMVSDQISPRQGAIWDAVFSYQQIVSNQNRDLEGLEFFENTRPDVGDFADLPAGQSGTAMQWAAILMAHRALGPDVSRERWKKFVANLERSGGGWWKDDAEFSLMTPYLDGDLDEAARIAVEMGLNRPVAEWILRSEIYQQPFFESLVSHPLVATRLAERDRELEEAKAAVVEMLQGEEWQ